MDAETGKDSDNPILTGPFWPVFFRYALPSVAGLLALTTANIVDGVFIGNFAGADALAALNLLIPWFTLLFGMALALAIGGTVRAGRYLGEGIAVGSRGSSLNVFRTRRSLAASGADDVEDPRHVQD